MHTDWNMKKRGIKRESERETQTQKCMCLRKRLKDGETQREIERKSRARLRDVDKKGERGESLRKRKTGDRKRESAAPVLHFTLLSWTRGTAG